MDVAIVGIGIHPFGRTPERSGLQQGAYAARMALKDAGVEWKDMQFGFGGRIVRNGRTGGSPSGSVASSPWVTSARWLRRGVKRPAVKVAMFCASAGYGFPRVCNPATQRHPSVLDAASPSSKWR